MLRLVINLWLLIGFIGSVMVATMVFAFIFVLFKQMMEKLK